MKQQDKPSFKIQRKLYRMTYDHITTESEILVNVGYVIDGDNMAILTAENGCLALSLDSIPEFCNELMGLYEVYKDNKRIVKNQLEFLRWSGERRKRRDTCNRPREY